MNRKESDSQQTKYKSHRDYKKDLTTEINLVQRQEEVY